MTITQPLALTAGYMTKQFVNRGGTQIPDVFGSLANPTAEMTDSYDDSVERAQAFGTHAIKRTSAYVKGDAPVAGKVSAKVACCTPNQDFLRDFYDAASYYGGTVPAGIVP